MRPDQKLVEQLKRTSLNESPNDALFDAVVSEWENLVEVSQDYTEKSKMALRHYLTRNRVMDLVQEYGLTDHDAARAIKIAWAVFSKYNRRPNSGDLKLA